MDKNREIQLPLGTFQILYGLGLLFLAVWIILPVLFYLIQNPSFRFFHEIFRQGFFFVLFFGVLVLLSIFYCLKRGDLHAFRSTDFFFDD